MGGFFDITDADIEAFINELDWGPNKDCAGVPAPKKSTGCICTRCKEFYEYAEPNQKDGSFKCFSCRNY